MKRTALALPESLWREFLNWLREPDEVAGVLTARVIDDGAGTTLLGRSLHRSPDDTYLERSPDRLALRSTGWLPAVRGSRSDGAMALFVHTHPRGRAIFSKWDDEVDNQLWRPFLEHSGGPLYGAVVVAGNEDTPSIAGRLRDSAGVEHQMDLVRVVGDRLLTIPMNGDPLVPDAFDRQVRAFGGVGQQALQLLRIGVVGAGGTGSPVTEQLIRLGVGSLVIIDDDVVTPSTVARGYGSGIASIGEPKVEVLRNLAARIGFGTTVEAVNGNLRNVDVAQRLRHCDVVFSCTDGHAARLILNRWAYSHLAPVIDVAVLVSSPHEGSISIDGRVTWISLGAACLLCRGRIDPTVAYAEQLDPDERRRLTGQGYVPELEEPQPSVVTLTTLMAGLAVTELLNRMFGLADTAPTEILVRLHDRMFSLNRRKQRVGCFCGAPEAWGRGVEDPYLDLTWP